MPLCQSPPMLVKTLLENSVHKGIQITTRSYPCLNYYHELFYPNGIKKLPIMIGELLTPSALAHWIM